MAPPKTYKGGNPGKSSKGTTKVDPKKDALPEDPKKSRVPPTASERRRRVKGAGVGDNVSEDADVQRDEELNVGKSKVDEHVNREQAEVVKDKSHDGNVVQADNENDVDKSHDANEGEAANEGETANEGEANKNKADHQDKVDNSNVEGSIEKEVKGDEKSADEEHDSDDGSDGGSGEDDGEDEDEDDDSQGSGDEENANNEGSGEEENDNNKQSGEDEDDDNDGSGDKVEGSGKKGEEKELGQLRVEVKLDFSASKLYQSFKTHVASMLLKTEVKDRGPLTCKQYTKKLLSWKLENEHPSVVKLVKNSPLNCLRNCSYKSANRVLISAFVERWHAETNTFHNSFGEMTITLDDVLKIIGLPITGKSMTGIYSSSNKDEKLEDFVERMLGIPAQEVLEEFDACKSKCVKYKFLRKQLTGKAPDTYTPEQVARGYLLFLLGCTIFQDKTGDKVQIKYLYYLEHWDDIEKWAWGAAALAYLYRELGKASRLGTKTISGYLTLLEAWIYEHFPVYRPHDRLKLKKNEPRTAQWKPSSQYNIQDTRRQLHYMRINLDGLTKKDVVWTPYRKLNESPPKVVWFTGTLMIHDIDEPYQPDRVVRQFGHIQDVPRDPIAASRVAKVGKKAMSYMPVSIGRTDEFNRWDDHVINPKTRGEHMKKNGECTKEYDKWVKANCICRLDYSVKDPLAHVIVNEEVDEDIFKALQILEKIFARKNARRDELFAAIGLAKELIKPKNQSNQGSNARESGEGSKRSTRNKGKEPANAPKKRKRN